MSNSTTPMVTRSEMTRTEQKYINLAIVNLGEAATEIANVCLRGGVPGSDFANVFLSLRRIEFALNGLPYEAPPRDPQHVDTSSKSGAL